MNWASCLKPFFYVLCFMTASSWACADDPAGHDDVRQPLLFGAFTYGGVWRGMEPVHQLESDLNRQLDIVHWFMNWDHRWDATLVGQAAHGGRRPLISWQPHTQEVKDIAAGHYDAYIRSWAQGAKAHGTPVYLRPFPEMNGDWLGWNGEPDALVAAWQRMVKLFREEGADNVRWVWSPNVTDWPRTEANRMENYYPGEAYVDVLALDGYNFGDTRDWSGWRSFDEIFEHGYARVANLGSQPIWIAEIASAESGGDKGVWIRDMLSSTTFPRVEAIVWFDEKKGSDWRARSSDAALDALREGLSQLPAISEE